MSATTHPVATEEVMALLDGELSPERAETVSKHIHECAECSGLLSSLRGTSRSLTGWTTEAATQRLEHSLHSALAKKVVPGTNTPGIFARPAMWTWKQRVMGFGLAVMTLIALFWAATPNLLRSRMAANQAVEYRQWSASHPGGTPEDFFAARAKRTQEVDLFSDRLRRRAVPKMDSVQLNEKGKREVPEVPLDKSLIQNEPMIARTVSLSIVVKDFDAGRSSLDAILTRRNGYAANLSASTPQGAARVIQASLRIPAAQLAAAIAELKALGRVENEAQNGEEVTQQHADLVARLKNSRETEQRLQDVLRTRTGKVKDVLEVEEEIARVRGEIEQMEAEQKTLEHRVEFATIELKLSEEYKAQLTTPAPSVWVQLRNATINGFRNAFDTLLGIVLFFAESGPTLAVWLAILGFPAWLVWRRYRRVQALSLGA